MVREPMQTIEVATKPATQSKINWTQIAGMFASVAAFFGLKDLDPAQIAQAIMGIQAITGLVTVLLRTYHTKTVTPAVAAQLTEDA